MISTPPKARVRRWYHFAEVRGWPERFEDWIWRSTEQMLYRLGCGGCFVLLFVIIFLWVAFVAWLGI